MNETDFPNTVSPAEPLELQEVLTRYIDSRNGYSQAADLVEEAGLASTFRSISGRRALIAKRLAGLIDMEGETPDLSGSPEAGIHRWWIRLKEKFSKQETKSVITECLRGERELARTLNEALEHGHLEPSHSTILRDALAEVDLAIGAFEGVIEEH